MLWEMLFLFQPGGELCWFVPKSVVEFEEEHEVFVGDLVGVTVNEDVVVVQAAQARDALIAELSSQMPRTVPFSFRLMLCGFINILVSFPTVFDETFGERFPEDVQDLPLKVLEKALSQRVVEEERVLKATCLHMSDFTF